MEMRLTQLAHAQAEAFGCTAEVTYEQLVKAELGGARIAGAASAHSAMAMAMASRATS